MKTSLFASILLVSFAAAGTSGAATSPPEVPAASVAAPATGAPAEPDAAVLAQLGQAVRDGRFGAAYKQGLRSSPPGPMRDRILALDDEIIGGVFARIAAPRFTIVEATAIAAFYASPPGRALTDAQLADPLGPPVAMEASHRAPIEAFFASETGRKFNAVVADPAVREEMQLALVFIAGPDGDAAGN